jgi:hypothetical protein
MDTDTYTDLYSDLCDIVARALYDIPDDDPFSHTGDMPRKIVTSVLDYLAIEP